MESRKMILMNLSVGKERRRRCREWTSGHSRGRGGWGELSSSFKEVLAGVFQERLQDRVAHRKFSAQCSWEQHM